MEQVLEIDINKIAYHALNPNEMDSRFFKMLQDSITKYGFIDFLIVREIGKGRYQLIDGEHRLLAAKKLGYKKLPCVVTKLSDADAKINLLMLNRLKGKLNQVKVAKLLNNLQREEKLTDDQLVKATGFDLMAINSFTTLLKVPETTLYEHSIEDIEKEQGNKKDVRTNEIGSIIDIKMLMIPVKAKEYDMVLNTLEKINKDIGKALVELCREKKK